MTSRTGRPLLLTARITLWRARRALLATAVLAIAFVLTGRLAPAEPRTVPVVVAAREIPAGHALTHADLRVQATPVRWAPDEAVGDPGDLLSRRTTVTLPRGLPVVVSTLEGDRFGVDPPAGSVVVAVTVSAAAADGMLEPGDVVDLVAPATAPGFERGSGDGADGSPAVLARGAVVLDVGGPPDEESMMPDLQVTESPADLTAVVAVSPQEGRLLAAAASWGPLGTVLVS